jgi:hypothetical protein
MGDSAQDQPVRTGSIWRRSRRGARRPREVADRRGVSRPNGSCGFPHRPIGSGSVLGGTPFARRGFLILQGQLSRTRCGNAWFAGGGGTPPFLIEPEIDWPRCNGENVGVRPVSGHIILSKELEEAGWGAVDNSHPSQTYFGSVITLLTNSVGRRMGIRLRPCLFYSPSGAMILIRATA